MRIPKPSFDAVYQRFDQHPNAVMLISKTRLLKMTFKRVEVFPGQWGHYIIGRVIDKNTGKCDLAVGSPFHLSASRRGCLRSVVGGLLEDL